MMIPFRNLLFFCTLFPFFTTVSAQRSYKPASVLANGNWYKIGVPEEGVYRMDLAFLNSLGIQGSIPSSQLRLYGNGGGMLPEANSALPPDDLEENAIFISDGGDGMINGSDYILFYSRGPHHWLPDSVNHRFTHRKNIYSDKAIYFLTLGGTGLRIQAQSTQPPPVISVTSFNERYFHELDTVNFLSSGREWFGEEFSSAPGRTLSRNFSLPFSGILPQTATLLSSVAARSVLVPSSFNFIINGQPVYQVPVQQITTSLYDLFAHQSTGEGNLVMNNTSATVTINYNQGSYNSQGWLNWFEFFCRRGLFLPPAQQLAFRDWNSVGMGTAGFEIANADVNTQVWDVTFPQRPARMNAILTSGTLRFSNSTERLREYIAFGNSFLTPSALGPVPNQNLHSSSEKDLFIISYPPFLPQAQRLARFHEQQDNLRVIVVSTDQVYNEFSGGSPDPTAIRDFIKMYFDRYRSNWPAKPKSLLLLGRASFDYKDRIAGNTNFVPAYETPNSIDPLSTYTSDDYFGFLDDAEDINSGSLVNELDIGIGRIPARTTEEAANFVDKLLDYHSPSGFGPWRNNLNFIADDEDNNLHLQDAEVLTATVQSTAPVYNLQKIYLDAFVQESGSAGGRYPQANAMINNNIYNGTLFWNYSGHGGPARLAEEVVLDQQIVNGWNNRYRLPLFITATCDFAPYDNPTIYSLGEQLLVRPKTGAIALMTTTRLVFANSNRIINSNYLKFALEPDAAGRYKTLGEAMRTSKNFTYQASGDITNNRKFTLLGDPAMTLGFPKNKVRLTRVNGIDIASGDTLSAAEYVTMEGEVTDEAGTLLGSFNGTAYLTLFDKVQTIQTLGNDLSSQPTSFQSQENSLFRGKASVTNGKFIFRFKIPRDINYQFGNGRVSLYANDALKDGNGMNNNLIIGGISSTLGNDREGPEISAFLNDEKFVNGSITNASHILILKLADSSGINTGGSGIDHDIVATLDNDNRQYYILNNFYESDLDDFQKGTVRFQLPELKPGSHSLKIKAWDAMNNSSEYILDFIVVNTGELRLDHVLNYPNPFTTRTTFWFEHNYPGTGLAVKIEVFTVSGKLIKTLSQTINTPGNRSNDIEWDGRDEYGNKTGRGVYLYRLRVRSQDGKTAEKWERLVILGK